MKKDSEYKPMTDEEIEEAVKHDLEIMEQQRKEIACVDEYIKYLKSEIKRLETINKYFVKMQNSKKDKDKEYFLEGIKLMLSEGETIDNFHQILKEYSDALKSKEETIDKLYKEIKIIKKLKV